MRTRMGEGNMRSVVVRGVALAHINPVVAQQLVTEFAASHPLQFCRAVKRVTEPFELALADTAAPVVPAAPTSFTVKLLSYAPGNKINMIKEGRAITGLGLKESKDMVEAPLPVTVIECADPLVAEDYVLRLQKAGGAASFTNEAACTSLN